MRLKKYCTELGHAEHRRDERRVDVRPAATSEGARHQTLHEHDAAREAKQKNNDNINIYKNMLT